MESDYLGFSSPPSSACTNSLNPAPFHYKETASRGTSQRIQIFKVPSRTLGNNTGFIIRGFRLVECGTSAGELGPVITFGVLGAFGVVAAGISAYYNRRIQWILELGRNLGENAGLERSKQPHPSYDVISLMSSIFEAPDITKFFWDVRNDADALWANHRVGLAGVIDIQLLENASRDDDKTYIRGLDKSVQYDLKLGFMELHRWLETKKYVKDLMPNKVFSQRPLDAKTIQYCVNDVVYLPALYDLYLKRIKGDWLTKVVNESARRVVEAHGVGYEPQSESKTLGSWGAGGWKRRVTMDQMLAMVDEDMMGCYDNVSDDNDWGGMNAHDGAQDSEAFYSCRDKN